jgi:hypothetical protein
VAHDADTLTEGRRADNKTGSKAPVPKPMAQQQPNPRTTHTDLVQHEQVRLDKERRGQRHAHAPAPREGRDGEGLHLVAELQPIQDPRRAGLGGGGADDVEPGVDLA